jgi:uncharacterized protein (TIGR00251 family)
MRQTASQDSPEGTVLTLHVQPGAACTELAGMHGDAWKVRVAAAPVGGAANEELRSFLAERFGISKSAVVVTAGQRSRRKRILLKGISSRRVREVFGP